MTTHREFAAAREASDVLVVPEIPGVGLQDWKSYDPAVEAGRRAAREVLAALPVPVSDMRRHAAATAPRLEMPAAVETEEAEASPDTDAD